MPTILNPVLKLTRQDGGLVNIEFSYKARFPFAEMQLTKLGLIFVERVEILGVDPPGGTTGEFLGRFYSLPQDRILDVPSGDEYFPKPVAIILQSPKFITTMTRGSLDEDPSPPFVTPDFDPDEIRCRVEIRALMPTVPTAVGFSNQEVLGQELEPHLDNVQVINNEDRIIEFKLSR